MSTAIETTNRSALEDLLAQVGQGKILEAFEQYYDEAVVMHDPMAGTVPGKDANREREAAFLASVAEVHAFEVGPILAGGDQTAYWNRFEFSTKDGQRVNLQQIAHQSWKDGRIVEERFLAFS